MIEYYRIRAFDPLFFRDDRPFNRGETYWATGKFPPALSVLRGAFRSAWLSENLGDEILPTMRALKNSNKSDAELMGKFNTITVNNLFLETETRSDSETGTRAFLIPAPLDYFPIQRKQRTNDSDTIKLMKGTLKSLDGMITSTGLEKIVLPPEKFKPKLAGSYYVPTKEYKKYFHGDECVEAVDISTHNLALEPKIGIGRDDRYKSTREGALYRLEQFRLKNMSLVIGVDFGDLEKIPDQGYLKLGGFNRPAAYEKIERKEAPDCFDASENEAGEYLSGTFKLITHSPAIFKEGWLPDGINKTFEAVIGNVKIKLIAATVGKYQTVGGYDMLKNEAKPIAKAVPPGSVYYLEVEGNASISKQDIKNYFNNINGGFNPDNPLSFIITNHI